MNPMIPMVFFQGIVVKLNSDLSVAWSQDYGLNSGADQIFDLVVDRLFRWTLALNLMWCCIFFPQRRELPTWRSHNCWCHKLGLSGHQGQQSL